MLGTVGGIDKEERDDDRLMRRLQTVRGLFEAVEKAGVGPRQVYRNN